MSKKLFKIVFIYGTRPEIIKLAPVIREFRKSSNFHIYIINSGQHSQMVNEAQRFFKIFPNHSLNLMTKNQPLDSLTSKLIKNISWLLKRICPDLVIIQGDTTTALCSALASFYLKIKVAHIEAGLRSNDLSQPFPEELNRIVISKIADFNFAPTKLSKENLLREGISKTRIFVTGNTIVDSINTIVREKRFNSFTDSEKSKYILVTAHRRENFFTGIESVCKSILRLRNEQKDIKFIWPVHPNPNVTSVVYRMLKDVGGVKLISPVSYLEALNLIYSSYIVWTDSGGIQEEVTSIRKPVLILRNVTERPEVITSGFGKIVGTNVELIVKETKTLLLDKTKYRKMISGKNPFGDGKASQRIVKIIRDSFD